MHLLEDYTGLRSARVKNRGCAHVKRKHQPVSETIGVEQLGGGKRDVFRTDSEDTACVVLATMDPVML
jgi:hypothetical protein